MEALLLIYDEGYLNSYYTSTVECPERVKAVYAKLRNHFPVIRPEPAERGDILRIHTSAMMERVEVEDRETYKPHSWQLEGQSGLPKRPSWEFQPLAWFARLGIMLGLTVTGGTVFSTTLQWLSAACW